MKKARNLISLAIISVITSACSSSSDCHSLDCENFYKSYTKTIIEKENKLSRTNKINTLRLRTKQLGGAAIRQEGYVHVLASEGCCEGKTPLQSDWKHKYDNLTVGGLNLDFADAVSILGEWDTTQCLGSKYNKEIAQKITDDSDPKSITIVNSTLDMGRWERYCNQGSHMNENDWLFVKENSYQVPEEFEPFCVRPDFTYEEYLAAWESFCNADNKTSKKYMTIIKKTVRPKKLIQNCKIINNLERSYKK